MSTTAGDGDLGEAQRVGLILVEVKRGGKLPREAVHFAARGLPGLRRAFVDRVRRRRGGDVERALDRLGLFGADVESPLDRGGDAGATPVEYAGELAEPPVGDGDGRAVVSDRDGDAGSLGPGIGGQRL